MTLPTLFCNSISMCAIQGIAYFLSQWLCKKTEKKSNFLLTLLYNGSYNNWQKEKMMPDILYDKLSRELEEMIRSGKFGNKLPGIHKLAKILGANHITVRKAVELLIDRGELEVIPSRGTFVRENENPVRNFHVIGCIGIFCNSSYREMVINQQNDRIRESGYKILDIAASSRIFQENPRLLLQFPVDGYIFFGSSLNQETMTFLLEHHIPVISTINSKFPEINHVGADHFYSYAEAIRKLKLLGCRRIAFLSYQRQSDFQNYIEDIRSIFMRELGSDFEPELFSVYDSFDYYIRYGELFHQAAAEDCVRSWRGNPPDGLISSSKSIPTIRQLAPEVKTAAFSVYGSPCDECDISLCENLPGILDSGSRRMLEIFSGDTSVTEIRIPFFIREREKQKPI